MSLITHEHSIYFLGIGGIGMSALARYFIVKGYEVHGYDKTETELTLTLEKEGMQIHYHEDISLIPLNTGMVIFTPAVPTDNTEFIYLKNSGIRMLKRAEVLGMLSSEYKTIACAGTHGKTTTSTLVSHLMHQSSIGCQAFLGGISRNFNNNLLVSETSEFMVVEADEYDRSFLHLHPQIAIITSLDSDHLDIYHSHDAIIQAFSNFAGNILPEGALIVKKGIETAFTLPEKRHVYTYAVNEKADFYADNLKLVKGLYNFDFHYPAGIISSVTLGIPGLYNVENSVAAMAAVLLAGLTPDEISNGLTSFRGVKRRFDIRYNENGRIYIDDYAHHPEELNACIRSAKAMFPESRITGIFQPHLFSRTRDFADDFAKSLDQLDEILLLPIYPAREKPIEGVTSEMLLEKMISENKHLLKKEEIESYLEKNQPEVLITMGAGDIDTLVPVLESFFMKTKQ